MKYLLLCCMLLALLGLNAQDKNRVFGKVTFKITGAAIPNASVFVSGTSLGTTTNAEGDFELNGMMPGNFQLVISSIGYATIVYPFSSDQLPLKLNVQMDLKAQELDQVTVEPFDPDGWNKYGPIFLQQFIGNSAAARQCHLTNPGALRFRYNRAKRLLTVVADEPLLIKNDYMGYTIRYQLEEFSFNQSDGTIFFYGFSHFTDDMEKRNRIPLRITNRRKDIYNGSMTHFMHSLYHDRLAQEGFEVRRLVTEANHEKERVRNVMQAQQRGIITSGGVTVMRLGVTQPEDSLNYYRNIMRQPNQIKRIGAALLNADSLLTPGQDSTKALAFPNLLQITYKKGKEEQAYLMQIMHNRKPGPPVSEIFLVGDAALSIYPNGYFYPPQAIFSLEYWAWSEKISHLLPLGYEASGKNN